MPAQQYSKYKDLPPLPSLKDTNYGREKNVNTTTASNNVNVGGFGIQMPPRSLPSPIYSSLSGDSIPQRFEIKSIARRPPPLLNLQPQPNPSSKPSKLAGTSKQATSNSNVIINQPIQSPVSAMPINNSSEPQQSTRQLPSPYLESKSLKRKNVKQLTLDFLQTDNCSSSPTTTKVPLPGLSASALTGSGQPMISTTFHHDASLSQLRDPDKKSSTDELIANIQNLELGLEYQLQLRPEDFVLLKKLGSGNSGTVSKVLHLPTQKPMARKIIHVESKEVIQAQIIRELRIMHECDSPFIVGFYGSFLNEGDVVICMEYVDCGSLDKIFKLTGPFPDFILRHVAYSVLSGLNYLYDNHRIIHRDVKPSNVLLDSKGNMKLCDFGVSRELINSMADTFVGTSTYMSPERIQGGVYSVKGDVWSLGLMLYELASGKFAFGGNGGGVLRKNGGPDSILDLLQRIVNEKPPSLNVIDGFSPELCEFVDLCLKKEKQRSDPHELMRHPFLADFIEDEETMLISSKYRSGIKRWSKNVRRVQKGKPMK